MLVGINLLREGLDIPECALVAILDADKEGFLRSQTSLIQTIGRAARNIDGRVILDADTITVAGSGDRRDQPAPQEAAAWNGSTGSRRESSKDRSGKSSRAPTSGTRSPWRRRRTLANSEFLGHDLQTTLAIWKASAVAAADLEFEEAARLRDETRRMEALDPGLEPPPAPSASLMRPTSATGHPSRWDRAVAATIRRSGAGEGDAAARAVRRREAWRG